MDGDFTAHQPGTRLVEGITYLRTTEGWLHLAIVINLATRMVVGWQITDEMRTGLVIEALEMARLQGQLRTGATIHHNRRTECTATTYAAQCADIGVRVSMGRLGLNSDNAIAESFFATLKNEMYHR